VDRDSRAACCRGAHGGGRSLEFWRSDKYDDWKSQPDRQRQLRSGADQMRMRRSTVALAISLALAGPVHPQASNTTTGACSPIVSQNSGPVTIECSGISEDVQRQLTEVLNSILQKQLDPAAVMSKLDEIAKGVGDLKEKAFDAERGILTTYEFNGAKREQAGG
jgi:hypothetical protein